MTHKKIRKLSELPPEFSLEKYAPVRNFGVPEWLANLEVRLPFFDEFLCPDGFRRRFLDPLRSGSDFDKASIFETHGLDCVQEYMTIDFYWQAQMYLEGRFKKVMGRPKVVDLAAPTPSAERRMENVKWRELHKTCSVNTEGQAVIKINLNASDEQLMQGFADMVAELRRATGILAKKNVFDQDDFDLWERFRVLPYIDLTTWARINNVQLTQQLLGATLFPDEYEVALGERIRKVVEPLSMKMCTKVFHDTLRSQLNGILCLLSTDLY